MSARETDMREEIGISFDSHIEQESEQESNLEEEYHGSGALHVRNSAP